VPVPAGTHRFIGLSDYGAWRRPLPNPLPQGEGEDFVPCSAPFRPGFSG
jgi:hypothetical protein